MSLVYNSGDFGGSRPNDGQIWASAVDVQLDGIANGEIGADTQLQELLADMPGRTDCIEVLSTLGIEVAFSADEGFRVWRGPAPIDVEDYIDETPKFFS